MANEFAVLSNPDSTPGAVSSGYQRQNTNAVAARVGMDASVVSGGTGQCTLEISGPVDVNGVLYSCGTAVNLTPGSGAGRYFIYLSGSGNNLTPTLAQDDGTFDADKNARYTSGGYRVLNWIIDYDGTDCVAYRWLSPESDENETKSNITRVFAYRSTNQAAGTVVFDTEIYDDLGEYNNSTGVFTAQKSGHYLVNVNICMDDNSTAGTSQLTAYLYKNSSQLLRKSVVVDNGDGDNINPDVSISQVIQLDAGDTFYMHCAPPYSEQIKGSSFPLRTYMSIHKLG